MLSRRHFLGIGAASGFAALGAPGFTRRLWPTCAAAPPRRHASPLDLSAPINLLPDELPSVMVNGMPFAEGFTGDHWSNEEIPFHGPPGCAGGGSGTPEEVDIVIVGGGISGLGTAMLLRDHQPVLLEMRDRFGGVAQGERWQQTGFSLGNAYVITPDPGTFLEEFYAELGLDQFLRVDDQDSHIEIDGEILDDFFDAQAHPPHERAAFNKYRQVVQNMASINYPDIPLPGGRDDKWIVELDQKTFRQDIEDRMHMAIPESLAGAIQAYTYSSFAAGWEEISAAGGWNFLAAEEFGRWVFPGGTSWMANRMWEILAATLGQNLRAGCRATRVELTPDDRVLVTYLDGAGDCRTILARRVVMACPKLSAKHILPGVDQLDPGKLDAMNQMEYRAYVVANVLLDAPIDLDFYDVFLLADGSMPMNQDEAQAGSRVIDMLNGHFYNGPATTPSVLTLYWPLPFDFGRWTLLIETSWQDYAQSLVPQIESMLGMLGVPTSAVKQVRMTRWGHAVPINRPGLMADGTIDALRRPLEGKIFFVNQDNWALPAVENCLLDAEIFVPQVLEGL